MPVPKCANIARMVEQVAPSTATVLITGESGTGKEVVADAIHTASPRRGKPMIKVSCAALPETLLEAELFGYEKGAFTGANARKEGRFELANGGTLFLDEIGEVTPGVQVKLLRVLQDGKFERLGGTRTIDADVRIITATNKDLQQEVEEKRFREDLFYRLNVINIRIPALRERKDDIHLLAMHFLKIYADKNRKQIEGFSEDAMLALTSYDWPGNVRELENAIERAVVFTNGNLVPLVGAAAECVGFCRIAAFTDIQDRHAIARTRSERPSTSRCSTPAATKTWPRDCWALRREQFIVTWNEKARRKSSPEPRRNPNPQML